MASARRAPEGDDPAPLELVREDVGGYAITFRRSDAYGNLTELCQSHGRKANDFLKLPSTNEFLKALAEELDPKLQNIASPYYGLVITIRGGTGHGSTWAHPLVTVEAARWCSPRFGVACNRVVLHLLTHGSVSLTAPTNVPPFFAELAAEIREIKETLALQHKTQTLQHKALHAVSEKLAWMGGEIYDTRSQLPAPAPAPVPALPAPAPLPSDKFMRDEIPVLVSRYVLEHYGKAPNSGSPDRRGLVHRSAPPPAPCAFC